MFIKSFSSARAVRSASMLRVVLLGASLFLLSACGGGPSGGPSYNLGPNYGSSSSAAATREMTLLSADGTRWVKTDGSQFNLRGTNLGSWLLQEFWMMGQSTAEVDDQCTLEGILDDRFGFNERERLMKVFRDNWITERDWDLLQDFGMNVVRLPFIWNLIEDENNPYHLRDDAWDYLDAAIEEARARDIYVILDHHGAAGSQGWEHHSGCAGQNLYWEEPETYQPRTKWLWQQIAERYKDENIVAAYGLPNEPWGTDSETLATAMIDLYHTIREIDDRHIIILPGHNADGIDAYGIPAEQGLTNVAFDMHFYPGIFGWGEIGYDVHRDWLLCGPTGATGVCEWAERLSEVSAPFLVGEFQPWTGQQTLELGGQIARATYDTYVKHGWAATNWSYKVLSNGGGAGNWGMVTNHRGIGMVAKSDTWNCAGWDGSIIAESCEERENTVTVDAPGTYYLVIKVGAWDGELDVSIDSISLIDSVTGAELINNGDFGSDTGWTEWLANEPQTLDYNYEGEHTPAGSDGPVLRVTAPGHYPNGGIYQAITLEGGKSYTLSGVFSDNGSSNTWAEIYLVTSEPETGEDVTADVLPQMDFHNASIEEIEELFKSFGSMEYAIHEPLMHWLTTNQSPTIFDLPVAPTLLSRTLTDTSVNLSWQASASSGVEEYRVYRSTVPGDTGTVLATVQEAFYNDATGINDEVSYYYTVTAVRGDNESYPSNEVVGSVVYTSIPGLLRAENYSDREGSAMRVIAYGDSYYLGHLEPGYWFEYTVNIATAGTYTVEYHVATPPGSDGFRLLVGNTVADTRTIPATGGWEIFTTLSSEVMLPAGQHTLRFDVQGSEWNFNWVRFTAKP